MAARFRGVVNEPRFKAVAQLGDAKTMSDFLRDSLEEFGADIELVTYSMQPDTMLAGARHKAQVDYETFLRAASSLTQVAFDGEIGTGTIFAGGRPYSVVSVPVPSSDRLSIAGVLTIGMHFGHSSLEELKSLTRTDIAILAEGKVRATTLTRELPLHPKLHPADGRASDSPRVMIVVVDGEHFLALASDYIVAAGRPGFHYLLLSSYETRLRDLRDAQLLLAGASLLGILISGGSVWFLIRRITQPLRALRDGAEAVGRGDFTRRIEQFSQDECGELAGAFNQMTANLLTSRNELERTVDVLRSTDSRLRSSEEQLRLTIESARDHMICTLDPRGRVLHWNGAAERVLGYTTVEVQGLNYATFFAPEECTAGIPAGLLEDAAATGRGAFEGWRLRRDGTQFWADVTLSRLPDSAGFVEISRDNTLRRETEQTLRAACEAAEAANRAKTEFVANMSHELRTPMNAIIGMSSLLLDDPLPEDTRDCVKAIRTSADSLLETIDDILDISKIEAGRLDLNLQPFDLCGCIEDIVDLFAVRYGARGLSLAVHLARDVPAIIVSDAARLRQILGNLVGNALKFTKQGGVTLSVSTEKSPAGEDRLLFSVADTGIGIPANRMDRLFKAFSQVDASSTRRFGGTGLGLAIGHRLVELMQGTIGVESEEGRGSRFFFSIPTPAELPRAAPEFSGLECRRVLVVGPATIATKGVCEQLATWGTEVTESTGWKEAKPPFDFVVLGAGATINAPAAGNEWPPILQLAFSTDARPDPSIPARIAVTMPVKPRALYAAALKALDAAAPVRRVVPKPSQFSAEFSARHPLRILLVEDNPVNARVAQLMLKRLGYTADWVDNGRKVLELLAERVFDLILMDLQMPEMSGLDATRALFATMPRDDLPYIIALTANARKDDRDACQAAGMHDFISKPVHLEKLAAGLSRAHAWHIARGQTIAALPV